MANGGKPWSWEGVRGNRWRALELSCYHAGVTGERFHRANGDRRGRAFTLVEVLAVMAIIALLLAILLPAISHVSQRSRGFRCQMSARSVAFDFGIFADESLHGDRGSDESDLGPRRFRLETFQESLYGIDEFWRWGPEPVHAFPDEAKADPMRCASVKGQVTVWKNTPCSQGGAGPPQNISYGFNGRLHVAEYAKPGGKLGVKPVHLDASVTAESQVPLLWDVDGNSAFEKGVSPVFSAPTLDSKAAFADDRLWFPGVRHLGAMNVAFVDGHVAASRSPLAESGWRWEFQGPK